MPVALALRRAINGRAIVVAAVGNEGPTAPPAFPADEPGVIGVTAVDNHRQSYADANRGDDVDFAAPGVRVWTPGPTAAGSYHTGTSFATPFVTAAVAARLVEGAKPDPTASPTDWPRRPSIWVSRARIRCSAVG
jgi:minor extracellular protease Epr